MTIGCSSNAYAINNSHALRVLAMPLDLFELSFLEGNTLVGQLPEWGQSPLSLTNFGIVATLLPDVAFRCPAPSAV